MAEQINNGGPAFPVNSDKYAHPDSAGMSLRDYFAAKAMQAYFTDPNVGFDSDAVEAGARAAYRIADAMLRAREGGAA